MVWVGLVVPNSSKKALSNKTIPFIMGIPGIQNTGPQTTNQPLVDSSDEASGDDGSVQQANRMKKPTNLDDGCMP